MGKYKSQPIGIKLSTKQVLISIFNKELNGIASSGYDAMLLLANSIEQAHSTDLVAVRDALAATKYFPGSTYISHYDER